MDEGFSQYNLHIALGTIGALGVATEAIIASTDSDHGGIGIAPADCHGRSYCHYLLVISNIQLLMSKAYLQ